MNDQFCVPDSKFGIEQVQGRNVKGGGAMMA